MRKYVIHTLNPNHYLTMNTAVNYLANQVPIPPQIALESTKVFPYNKNYNRSGKYFVLSCSSNTKFSLILLSIHPFQFGIVYVAFNCSHQYSKFENSTSLIVSFFYMNFVDNISFPCFNNSLLLHTRFLPSHVCCISPLVGRNVN